MSLGQDFAADAMAAFSGELEAATLTKQAETAYNVDDPTGAPSSVPVDHPCEGIAFNYAERQIDGTRILRGDCRVVILRGSLDVTPAALDTIRIPPPGEGVAVLHTVVAVEAATEAAYTLQVRR